MPFPTYDDAVDVAQLQGAIVEMLGQRLKSGSANGTIAIGQTFVDVNVSFPTPFASTPNVFANPRTTDAYRATPQAKTAAGATIRLFRPAGAATSAAATVPFDWNATDLGNA